LFDLFIRIRAEILVMTYKKHRNETIDVISDAPTVMAYQSVSLGLMMDEFIQSAELKSIIAQQWMYLGLPPSQVSSIYYAYVWTEYHLYGGYYPVGRSQNISNALRDIITEQGGEVRLRQEVARILVRDGRCYGVELKNGEVLESDLVISNADPKQTFEELVGYEHLPKRYVKKIEAIKPSMGCVQAYVVLDMDLPAVYGEKNHEVFVNDYYDLEQGYQEIVEHRYDAAPMYITIYENVNPDYHERGKTTLSLFTISDLQMWTKLDEAQYLEKKAEVTEILLNRLERLYPGCKAKVEYVELSTPMTNRFYTKHPQGAIYGATQSVEQSLHRRLQQTTPIAGLYLVGAWTQPGGGYSGVIWSGYNLGKQLLHEEQKGELVDVTQG
jgi:prolycopene isomerase